MDDISSELSVTTILQAPQALEALQAPQALEALQAPQALQVKPQVLQHNIPSDKEFTDVVRARISNKNTANMFIKQYKLITQNRVMAIGKIFSLRKELLERSDAGWNITPAQWVNLFYEVMQGNMGNFQNCINTYADEKKFLESWVTNKDMFKKLDQMAKYAVHIYAESSRKQDLVRQVTEMMSQMP